MNSLETSARIYVAGHRGMVGSAIVRQLRAGGHRQGAIECDSSKPDGARRKLMDSALLLQLGWRPRVEVRQGLENAYREFQQASAKQ